jgi:Pvc16 N-terminal domain
MSNFLAIATLTETIRYVLNHFVAQDVNGAQVTSVSPSGASNTGTGNGLPTLGANVFLYQVMPNAAARNLDLPTRRGDASAIQRPREAVDLHYIFSVYGSPANHESHRVLGSVLRTLHTNAVITRPFIEEAVAASVALGLTDLSAQDLSMDVELVKLVPLALTLDELSRVWSVYFQTSYALSVCYLAAVVYVEDTATSVSLALPVATSNIVVNTTSAPVVETITPQPATAGAVVTISGPNVGLGSPTVVFGPAPPVAATVVSDDQITAPLPATLSPGTTRLVVQQNVTFGTSASPLTRPGASSNGVAISLVPTLSLPSATVARGANLTVNFDTPIGPLQSVALVLGSFAIQLPGRSVLTAPAPVTTFTFTIPASAPTGLLPVRLQVDGVQSVLTLNPSTLQYTPSVTVT